MCTKCMKKGRKKVGIGNITEDQVMDAAELLIGAAGGGIATLELIKNIPSMDTDLKKNLRDGGIAAVGAGLLFVPKSYGGSIATGLGCGMIAVAGMNVFMRYFAAPALGGRSRSAANRVQHGKRRPHRVAGPHGSPVLQGRSGSPVLKGAGGPMQSESISSVEEEAYHLLKHAA